MGGRSRCVDAVNSVVGIIGLLPLATCEKRRDGRCIRLYRLEQRCEEGRDGLPCHCLMTALVGSMT